jgi:6-phosphogluconate dehydrogenase (decarboxylating)
MGKHMATNLIAANHHVTIFDVNPQAFDHFKEQSKKILIFYENKILYHYYRTSENSF